MVVIRYEGRIFAMLQLWDKRGAAGQTTSTRTVAATSLPESTTSRRTTNLPRSRHDPTIQLNRSGVLYTRPRNSHEHTEFDAQGATSSVGERGR